MPRDGSRRGGRRPGSYRVDRDALAAQFLGHDVGEGVSPSSPAIPSRARVRGLAGGYHGAGAVTFVQQRG
jgi:hypothetical protein